MAKLAAKCSLIEPKQGLLTGGSAPTTNASNHVDPQQLQSELLANLPSATSANNAADQKAKETLASAAAANSQQQNDQSKKLAHEKRKKLQKKKKE